LGLPSPEKWRRAGFHQLRQGPRCFGGVFLEVPLTFILNAFWVVNDSAVRYADVLQAKINQMRVCIGRWRFLGAV